MKKILSIVLWAALLVGCGDGKSSDDLEDCEVRKERSGKAINWDKLKQIQKDGENLFFAPGKDTPYTGWVKEKWSAGHDKFLGQFKDGKQDGPYTRWYENKKKREEGHFKGGAQDGQWTEWYENGQKKEEGYFKVGKQEGIWVTYRENGKVWYSQTFKDGKEVKEVKEANP